MSVFAGAVWSDTPLSRESLGGMLAASTALHGESSSIYHASVRPGLAHRPIPGVAMGYCGGMRALRREEEPPLAPPDPEYRVPHRGGQPVVLGDGALVCVFDGALDNRIELHRRLDGCGVDLRFGSDAEMLLYLFRDEGASCFSHLRGNFSAAIWDEDHQRLLLARDPWGTRPLYYRTDGRMLIFASSLRPLVAAMTGDLALDAAACDEYLTYGYVPAPHCLIEGVQKLPAGYVAIYRNERLDFRRYWEPLDEIKSLPRAADGAELAQALATAVRRQMGASPTVVWLRGGAASTLLAALASRVSREQVRAVSVGPAAQSLQHAAKELGIAHQHHEAHVPTIDDIRTLVADEEEPLAGAEAWAWRFLAAQSGSGDCRLLDATGAAELLGAHPRYAQCRAWSDRLPRWLYRLVAPRDARRQDEWQLRHKTLPPHQQRLFLQSVAVFNESQRAALYRPEHLACLPDADPFDLLRFAFHRILGQSAVHCFQLVDLATDVPGRQIAGLTAGMSSGNIEFRLPFLDPQVLRVAWSMSRNGKWSGRGAKSLRKILRRLLPSSLHPQTADEVRMPVSAWLKNELREAAEGALTSPQARILQFASPTAIAVLWEQHQRGRLDHGARLWSLLILELWLGQFSLRQPQPVAVTESVENQETENQETV